MRPHNVICRNSGDVFAVRKLMPRCYFFFAVDGTQQCHAFATTSGAAPPCFGVAAALLGAPQCAHCAHCASAIFHAIWGCVYKYLRPAHKHSRRTGLHGGRFEVVLGIWVVPSCNEDVVTMLSCMPIMEAVVCRVSSRLGAGLLTALATATVGGHSPLLW